MKYVLNLILILLGIAATLWNNTINQIALGLTVALISVALVILEIFSDKKSGNENLIQKYKEYKRYYNVSIGTIMDYYKEDDENPLIYPVKSYLYQLENKFKKRDRNILIKIGVITQHELEEIDFYKKCNQIELCKNYENIHNHIDDIVVYKNDFNE